MSAADLVDHIEATHHQYLWQELPSLTRWSRRWPPCTAPAIQSSTTWPECFDALRADLEPHLAKEEQVLFPMIRELAAAHDEAVVPLRFAEQPDRRDGA